MIVSKKTGKELFCYTNPNGIYFGKSDIPVDYIYYLWDVNKKKSKGYKSSELKTMLKSAWCKFEETF